jgi:hypothetical protein
MQDTGRQRRESKLEKLRQEVNETQIILAASDAGFGISETRLATEGA